MPKLIVPATSGDSQKVNLSASGAAGAVASGAEIGKVMQDQAAPGILSALELGDTKQKFGEWTVDQVIKAQRQQAIANAQMQNQLAMDDAAYNTASSNAIKDINQQASSIIDDTAAPVEAPAEIHAKALQIRNPSNITKQINDVATQTLNNYADTLPNQQSKQQLASSIDIVKQNQTAKALNTTRAAQVDLTHKALSEAINNDIQAGLLDSPENLGFYSSQGLARITKALEGGFISAETAQGLSNDLRKGLYFGSIQSANHSDPLGVQKLLDSKTYEQLHLSPIEYNTLRKENKLALQDTVKLNKIQYQTANEIKNIESRLYESQLSDGIKKGSVQSAQIMEAYDKGKIDYSQLMRLASTYDKQSESMTKKTRSLNTISASLNSGEVLSSYSPKEINDHYENSIKSMSEDGSLNNVPITTKVDIASHYKGPIDSLAKEIEYNVRSGDPAKIKESVFAFEKLNKENPLVLSNIKDKQFLAYISSLTNAYKYTTNLTPDNIQSIRNSVYDIDGKTLTKRKNSFSEISDFNTKNIKSTIADMYEGGNPWYRAEDYVPDELVTMMQPLLRDAYIRTGDVDSAKSMVANSTKALFGHSEVNNTPQWGLDSGSIMALPPEAMLAGKASAQEIRQAINAEITPLLPSGLAADQVFVGSDDKTIEEARQGKSPSYYLYYKDEDGQEILLPKRWSFDAASAQTVASNREAVANAHMIPKLPSGISSGDNKSTTTLSMPMKDGIEKTLTTTKGFGTNPVLTEDFINNVSNETYISNLARHYPGDKEQQPVVQAALTKMIGKDPESWRVSQSMQLVNSVLVNNSSAETFLKYGKATSAPMAGDIVVTNNQSGLYGGYRKVNGIPMIKMVYSTSQGLEATWIPESNVRGYRELPTPENFSRQASPLSISSDITFNPLTGERTRRMNAGDRFNIYTGEVEVNRNSDSKPDQKVLNSVTGQLVSIDSSAIPSSTSDNNNGNSPNIKVTDDYQSTDNSPAVDNSSSNISNTDVTQVDQINLETRNGKLAKPMFNPGTGKYTSDPDEGRAILQDLVVQSKGNAPQAVKDLIRAYVINFSLPANRQRKFTKDEMALLRKWYKNNLNAEDQQDNT